MRSSILLDYAKCGYPGTLLRLRGSGLGLREVVYNNLAVLAKIQPLLPPTHTTSFHFFRSTPSPLPTTATVAPSSKKLSPFPRSFLTPQAFCLLKYPPPLPMSSFSPLHPLRRVLSISSLNPLIQTQCSAVLRSRLGPQDIDHCDV